MDTMEKDKYLSMDEIEQLCRLYMECRLSIMEEAELNYVLGFLPYTSPIIDEVRALLNISLSCEMGETGDPKTHFLNKRKNVKRKLFFAVASFLLLISVGIPIFLHFRRNADIYCQVFTNGKEVSKEIALVMAEEEIERIDRFFENMKNIESEQQQKTESF